MSISKEKAEKVWSMRKRAEDDEHGYECVDDGIIPAKLYHDSRLNSNMAWEVDHIFPEVILKELGVPEDLIDDELNLRPLHHSNNESKGTQFPSYEKVVCWDEKQQKNVPCNQSVFIKDEKIKELEDLYKDYLDGKTLNKIAAEYNRKARN